MNRVLLNPFESPNLPRTIRATLEDERAICMRFNRHGNILAVGTVSGRVILWNFDTRAIATTLAKDARNKAGVRASRIVSLTFPAPGNASAVIVAYADGVLRVYHTLTGLLISELLFDVGLHQVEAHPKIDTIVIVVPVDSLPLLVHIRRGRYQFSRSTYQAVTNPSHVMLAPALDTSPSMLDEPALPPKTTYGNRRISNIQPPSENGVPFSVICASAEFNSDGLSTELTGGKRRCNFAVAFTRTKQRVLRGGSTGLVRVFELTLCGSNRFVTANCVSTVALPNRAPVRTIQLSRRERILINSQDRCMRLYNLSQIERCELKHDDDVVMVSETAYTTVHARATLTEIVNKALCKSACFSHDGDFIIGGMDGTQHRIQVWRAQDSQLSHSLEGPKEGIAQLLMHPLQSVMVTLGAIDGSVYIWAQEVSENWSAFSTQFSELEANEEYSEKEDEFDINHPMPKAERAKELLEKPETESADVDIDGPYGAWFPSDSDTEDSFFYVPVVPMPDNQVDSPFMLDDLMQYREDEMKEIEQVPENGNGKDMDQSSEDDNDSKRRDARIFEMDNNGKKRSTKKVSSQTSSLRNSKGCAKRARSSINDQGNSSDGMAGDNNSRNSRPDKKRNDRGHTSRRQDGNVNGRRDARRARGRRSQSEVVQMSIDDDDIVVLDGTPSAND